MSIEITLAGIGNVILGLICVLAIAWAGFMEWFSYQIGEFDLLSFVFFAVVTGLAVWGLVSMPVF